VNRNTAFLELKYGNIYGGPPNFYAISEASLLVFEHDYKRVFLESMQNAIDLNIVNVFSRTNELGNTIERVREVVNLKTKRKMPYDEEFRLEERDLDMCFGTLRPSRRWVKGFFLKNFRKYDVRDLVIFDGRRDIFLLEKSQVDFRRMNIIDLQKDITKETNYLFSLNKLAKVINFSNNHSYLNSNNLEYRLHPIAAKQIVPKTAAFDAARLMMVHNEFREHHDDFLMKAALLLNKIEMAKK